MILFGLLRAPRPTACESKETPVVNVQHITRKSLSFQSEGPKLRKAGSGHFTSAVLCVKPAQGLGGD